MKPMKKQSAFRIVLCLMLIIVGGCATNSGDFCSVYLPVPTLEQGSESQKLRTDQNNAVYMETCQ